MSSTAPATSSELKYELEITRVFNAPRELVWKMWTDPEHLKQWMGPRGFAALHLNYDVRPGRTWRDCLHWTGAESAWSGKTWPDLWQGGRYLEVVAPERLVLTFQWEGRTDIRCDETVITIRFTELEGKTVMHFHQAFFAIESERDGHGQGWNSSFDRLAEYIDNRGDMHGTGNE